MSKVIPWLKRGFPSCTDDTSHQKYVFSDLCVPLLPVRLLLRLKPETSSPVVYDLNTGDSHLQSFSVPIGQRDLVTGRVGVKGSRTSDLHVLLSLDGRTRGVWTVCKTSGHKSDTET